MLLRLTIYQIQYSMIEIINDGNGNNIVVITEGLLRGGANRDNR